MTERNTKTGRYTNPLDAICKCGARKGAHDAESPYANDATDCVGFSKKKGAAK